MKEWPFSYRVQFISGLYALLCIPATWLMKRFGFDFLAGLLYMTHLAAIPICCISGVIALPGIGKRLNKFHFAFSAAGLTLSFFYLLLLGDLFLGDVVQDLWHRRKFDSQVWKQSTDRDSLWPPRLCMVDNLIKSRKLNGLTKDEVIKLLGEPDGKGFPFVKNLPIEIESRIIHYYLGPDRGFLRIDSEWLFINFDENDKVKRCWIGRD